MTINGFNFTKLKHARAITITTTTYDPWYARTFAV